MINHSVPARATDPPFSLESVVAITHEKNIICSKALVCWQLFAGHVVSSRSMKREEKIHRIIVGFGSSYPLDSYCLLDKTNLPLNNWGQVYIFCLFVCFNFARRSIPHPLLWTFIHLQTRFVWQQSFCRTSLVLPCGRLNPNLQLVGHGFARELFPSLIAVVASIV